MRCALLAFTVALLSCAQTGPLRREDSREDGASCTTDLECSPGDECIRPRGQLNGLCGHLVDSRANPTTTIDRHADPCANDFDCPVLFRCELTTSAVGICVKQ